MQVSGCCHPCPIQIASDSLHALQFRSTIFYRTTMLTVPPSYRWYRDPLYLARLLVLGNLLFLLFSPPVTNVAEGLLYLLILIVPRVRRQVFSAFRQSM